MKKVVCDPEVEEVDDGPRRAGGASEDGEDEEPREEKDEDIGRPHARVHEPLRVLVQIRRRERLHVQLRHRRGPQQSPIASSLPAPTSADGRTEHTRSSKLCGRVRSAAAAALRWRGFIGDRSIGGGREGGMEAVAARSKMGAKN
uniref:Uncharacterized protein n=1 Tax=Arundo donax TaxID=35708 RepID=A0A0A9D6D6_ARUDO